GLLTLTALKNVAPTARATTLIKEIICPLDRVSKVSPTDPATNLLDQSESCSEGRTLVVDHDRLVGIVSPSDINRMLQRSIAGRTKAPAPSTQAPPYGSDGGMAMAIEQFWSRRGCGSLR